MAIYMTTAQSAVGTSMVCMLTFLLGLWASEAANEWYRGEPWYASAILALFMMVRLLVRTLIK